MDTFMVVYCMAVSVFCFVVYVLCAKMTKKNRQILKETKRALDCISEYTENINEVIGGYREAFEIMKEEAERGNTGSEESY